MPVAERTPQTLYDKVFQAHIVDEKLDGTILLYIDRHLVHEVTSPVRIRPPTGRRASICQAGIHDVHDVLLHQPLADARTNSKPSRASRPPAARFGDRTAPLPQQTM